jgi:hypothetical protein
MLAVDVFTGAATLVVVVEDFALDLLLLQEANTMIKPQMYNPKVQVSLLRMGSFFDATAY